MSTTDKKIDSDVVISGAGVAGLYTAACIAEKGYRVIVLESKKDPLKFSFNTLGSFIDYKKYGFTDDVIAAEISETIFQSRCVTTRKKGKAYIINKYELHRQLLERCNNSGVQIESGSEVKGVQISEYGSVSKVIDSSGREFSGKLYCDCTGYRSILLNSIGFVKKNPLSVIGIEYNVRYKERQKLAYLFYGKTFLNGYGWIFPVGGDRAIFGYGTFAKPEGISMKNYFDNLLLNDFSDLVEKDNDELAGGVFPVTEVVSDFVYNNVIGIGDSVSQGSPLLGEGYRFILDASDMAVRAVTSYLNGGKSALPEYEEAWRDKYLYLFQRHKRLQQLALKGSKNDLLADLLTFMLKTKRSSTFEQLISGNVKRRFLYFP